MCHRTWSHRGLGCLKIQPGWYPLDLPNHVLALDAVPKSWGRLCMSVSSENMILVYLKLEASSPQVRSVTVTVHVALLENFGLLLPESDSKH